MKRTLNTAFSVLALTLLTLPACVAQNNEPIETKNLKGQYDYMLEKAETYTEYKVIKKEKLSSFWKSVQDSLNMINHQKDKAYTSINSLRSEIDNLNSTIAEKDDLLKQGEFEKANINVLGMSLNKTAYSFVSLVVLCSMAVLIGLLLAKMKANSVITRNAKNELSEVEHKFEEHKKLALEKQMKLKRELQTERNKLMEVAH